MSRKIRIGIIGGMVLLILAVLGGLTLALFTSNSPSNSTNIPATKGLADAAAIPAITNPGNTLNESSIIVGPPDHRVDIAYPLAIPLSMNGPDIPTPETAAQSGSTPSAVMGAFATTDDLTAIETYYSKKLKAAGYEWDWEDACAQDTEVNCPQSRYFTAGIVKCITPGTGNASSICSSAYQVNLWLIGANPKPAEYKVMNIPQSIIAQLKPGQTLVGYSANSFVQSELPANTTMAVTTAAAVPTPTQLPVSTPLIPQTKVFVGPDNAFHVSQYDDNPEKQATFGASVVTTGASKQVKLGSDGTIQLDWLISEEGVKTSLQATVVTPHNTALTASKLYDMLGFAFIGDEGGRGKIPVHLVSSIAVPGTTSPNTYLWTMETTPLPPDRRNLSLNFEPALGIVTASPIQFKVKTYAEAGLPHPVNLQPQSPGGQTNGLLLVPQYAYFGPDRTILSLAFQPDVFKDKEAYGLLPQLVSLKSLKVTDDTGQELAPLDTSQPFNLSGLVFGPVSAGAKSLKIELADLVVGHNLNQPTTSLENAPVTRLEVPVANLLKSGQPLVGPTLETPGITGLKIEAMSARLDPSGQYATITWRYRVGQSRAYPPRLVARSVGFSCEICGQDQDKNQPPTSSWALPDGSVEFTLTYKYDPAQPVARLRVDSEQFLLPGPWQFKVMITR